MSSDVDKADTQNTSRLLHNLQERIFSMSCVAADLSISKLAAAASKSC